MMFICRRQLAVSAVLLSLVLASAYALNPRLEESGVAVDKYEFIKHKPVHLHPKTLHSAGIGFPVD